MAEDMNLQININGSNDTGGAFDSMDSAMTQLQKLAEDVSRTFADFAQTISTSFGDAGRSVEEMTRPLSGLGSNAAQVNELARAVGEVGTQAQEATRQIDNMNQAAGHSHGTSGGGHGEGGLFGIQGQMDTMYAGMAMGATAAPIDAGLGASIKAMADFDQAMRLVNEEMGLSNDKFGQLEQSILGLSNATGISSQDLANGLYNVVATGVTNTADALNLLKVSAEGAKAGNTDLNTATKAVNAVMGAYGMNAKDAGQIMDVMFTAVNNGQMHFTDLAKSVGASATSAATAGVSYTELAAAQATLTNVGKNAESASQNLNSLIMGMIAPTSQATKEAKKLGIEWDAQALKSHGLTYMIDAATKATHGNSEELKKLVPNQRAYMAVLALGSNAHKQYTDTLTKMKDANGATEEALKQTEQGAGESIEKMKAELTNAGIEIAMGLEPALKEVADKVQELTKWFSSLSPHTQKVVGEVALGAAAFLTLGSAFFMTISAVGGLVSGIKAISGAMKALFISEEAVAAGEALIDSLNPIGWVILITAVVVAVAALIITHWTQIKSWLENAWNSILTTGQKIWSTLVSTIGNFVSETVSTIQKIWNGAISWISGAAQEFVNIPVQQFQWLYNHNYYFKDLVDFIRNMWAKAISDAQSIWRSITSFLSSSWSGTVSAARSIFSALSSFFSGLWSGISSGVSSAWSGIVSSVSDSANSAIDAIKGPFGSLGSYFSDLWGQAESWGENLINMVGQGIQNAAGAVESAVSGVAGKIAGFLGFHSPAKEGPGSDADKWMPNLMNMFTKDIHNYTPQFQSAIGNVAMGIKTGFAATPSGTTASAGPTIIVYASGNVTRNEQQLGDVVSKAILNKVKMQGKI